MEAAPKHNHSLADYTPMLLCMLLWGGGPPVYKYLERHGCDAYTMCFFRTFSATLALTLWVGLTDGARLKAAFLKPVRFFLMGFLFIAGLLAFTAGTLHATATLAMLITRAIPLVAIGLGAFFFLDERAMARRLDFLIGLAIALAGLVGLCVFREGPPVPGALETTSWLGVALLLLCVLIWGVYSPLTKALLRGQEPFVVTTLVFWTASVLAVPPMLIWGEPNWVREAPALPVVVMLLSGPALMGFSEGLYYLSVKRLGLAPAASASLLVPFFTALYAWPVLGETPTWTVVAYGAVLLAGMALIVRARIRAGALPHDEKPDTAPNPQGAALPVAGHTEVKGNIAAKS